MSEYKSSATIVIPCLSVQEENAAPSLPPTENTVVVKEEEQIERKDDGDQQHGENITNNI